MWILIKIRKHVKLSNIYCIENSFKYQKKIEY